MRLVAAFVNRAAVGERRLTFVNSIFLRLPSCFMSLYHPNFREYKNLQS